MEISQEAFCTWLCQHEQEIVGRAGGWFHSPLAAWLSEVLGHVYGVDGPLYGRASWEPENWLPLPTWAQVLNARFDTCFARWMVGHEVFELLAQVEVVGRRLSSP